VWSVRFFKIIAVNYVVLAVDPNYQWALVGHPSRRYGWIFARSKTMDDTLYRQLLGDLEAQGYDPAKFQKVPQRAAVGGGVPAGAVTSH
jgi:apolipoprotein D and lipocalin family protein